MNLVEIAGEIIERGVAHLYVLGNGGMRGRSSWIFAGAEEWTSRASTHPALRLKDDSGAIFRDNAVETL